MIGLIPNSNSEPPGELREYWSDAARASSLAARRLKAQQGRDRRAKLAQAFGTQTASKLRQQQEERAKIRREIRQLFPEGEHLPPFLQVDAKVAKRFGALTVRTPQTGPFVFQSPNTGSFLPESKVITLSPVTVQGVLGVRPTKGSEVSTYRHEIGHANPRPRGTAPGTDRLFGQTFSKRYAEEFRAWKNAVLDGGGRLDWGRVNSSLFSYLRLERQEASADRLAGQHVAALRRYARRVRTMVAAEKRAKRRAA